MPTTEDVLVLGDYSALQKRTRKSGKQTYTVEIESKPLCIQTNAKTLGRSVAAAMAQHLRDRTQTISEQVRPATMRARLAAQKALVAGEPWAMQRYGGGRMGTMPPARSDRMFNDSGRFAKSLAIGAVADGWVINVAANRLTPDTLDGKGGGEAALVKIVQKLRELVPEFGDPGLMRTSIPVRRAITDVTKRMIQKTTDKTVEMSKQLLESQFELLAAVAG